MILNSLNETLIVINQTVCDKINRTVDSPNVTIGVTYVTLSLLFQIAYLPCFVTFLHRDHRCHSCFKLMIVIGIVDIITTNNDLTIVGFYSIIGISYCTAPIFSAFSNFISLTCWFAHCSLCILLNFNRCCNLYFGRTVECFTKSRLWLWIFMAFLYAFIMYAICPSGFYHSYLGIWLNKSNSNETLTLSLPHMFNNACVVVIIFGQYVFMAIILHQRLHSVSNRSIRTESKLSVLIQSVIICFFLLICSAMYIIIEFISLPPTLLPFIHISWMFSQGGKAFLYIAMNRKVRRNIADICCKQK